MGVYFRFLGMSLAIEMGDWGKLSVPAENQGVVKGDASEGSDATNSRSTSLNIQKRAPTLRNPAVIIIRIFGEEPVCQYAENQRGNYCIMPRFKLLQIGRSAAGSPFQSQHLLEHVHVPRDPEAVQSRQ